MSYPHPTQALDDLLERVQRLEVENAELRKHVSSLERDLVKSIQDYNQEYLTIYDLLWPLAYKTYPGLQTALSQFDAVMDSRPGRGPEKAD